MLSAERLEPNWERRHLETIGRPLRPGWPCRLVLQSPGIFKENSRQGFPEAKAQGIRLERAPWGPRPVVGFLALLILKAVKRGPLTNTPGGIFIKQGLAKNPGNFPHFKGQKPLVEKVLITPPNFWGVLPTFFYWVIPKAPGAFLKEKFSRGKVLPKGCGPEGVGHSPNFQKGEDFGLRQEALGMSRDF